MGDEDPTVPAPQEKEWFAKEDWLAMHESLLAESREKGDACKLVFLGDSITQGWGGEGKDVWAEHYADYGALNLGIGGDEVQHVTWRVQNGEVDAISPEVAVILIGTNSKDDTQPNVSSVRIHIEAAAACRHWQRWAQGGARGGGHPATAGRAARAAAGHQAAADGDLPARRAPGHAVPQGGPSLQV